MEGSLGGRAVRDITLVDLSLSGCLARCELLLDPGAILDLNLRLDDGPLAAKVRVTESSLDGASFPAEAPRYFAGLEFLGLPAKDAERLRRLIEDAKRKRSADTVAE
jgi:hypothetical protein